MNSEDAIKQKVQRWIVCGSAAIMLGKFIAFWVTNSVGILTDAMESIVNVIAGFISLYSLYWAAKPKDAEHPFGHGKVELISASIEGLLIMVAGGIIIFEGIRRLFNPSEIGQLDIGIIVVASAGVLNYLMGAYSIHMGNGITLSHWSQAANIFNRTPIQPLVWWSDCYFSITHGLGGSTAHWL